MPELPKILTEKNDRLEIVPTTLNDRIVNVQNPIWDELLALIAELDISNGSVVLSTANQNRIAGIIERLNQTVINSGYTGAVTQYSREYTTQIEINDEYFKEFFDFVEFQLGRNLVKEKQTLAVASLMDIEPTYLAPIRNTLNDAVATGQPFSTLVKQLKTLTIGDDEVNGKLAGHAKQISSDAFSIADATYTNAVSEEIGAEWYFYSGGLINPTKNARGTVISQGTRPFCKARDGKYYHRKEVEKWVVGSGKPSPSGTWEGKIASTTSSTIFTFRGGWNCKHSIMPVGLVIVPPSVVNRNISSGNFKPTKSEKEFLDLS